MDTIASGLGFYAKLKAYGSLFLFILFFISALCGIFYLFDKYELSKNSKITYKNINNNLDCDITDISNTNCSYYIEYTDIDNVNHKIQDTMNKNLQVGPTQIYYDKKNRKSYMNSTINPVLIPSICSCLLCLMILGTSVHIYFLSYSDKYATTIGGLQAMNDTLSVFKRK